MRELKELSMGSVVHAVIDSSALAHNWRLLRETLPTSCKIWAVVKANAYGHDLLQVGRWLNSVKADALGVARIEELQRLRDGGVDCRIIVMSGCHSLSNMELAREHRAEIVIHHPRQVESVLQLKKRNDVPSLGVWLKLDTGMNRLGIRHDEANAVRDMLLNHSELRLKGCMSHYANADRPEHALNQQQDLLFHDVSSSWPEEKSMANSAGILNGRGLLMDWVRPGIMCYGVSPFENKTGRDLNLKPVMSLRASIISVQTLQAGDSVGYGSRWISDVRRRVAVVACGYGDGYPQNAPDGTPVWVKGKRVPIVGRVSMDLLTVDITDCVGIDVGETVELWGSHLPVETIAQHTKRSSYELLTHVADRVLRQMV